MKDDIHVQASNFSIGQKCLHEKTDTLWKSLPAYLKLYMSVLTFKYQLNNYLLSEKPGLSHN